MTTKDAITVITAELARVRSQGHQTVDVDALARYLTNLQSDFDSARDAQKLAYDGQLAQYNAQCASDLESYRSVLDAGKEALNAASLINAGAAVAILSFLGASTSVQSPGSLGHTLTASLAAFGAGVFSAGLAHALRYLAQYAYHGQLPIGRWFHTATILFGLAGFVAFGLGVTIAYSAFSGHFPASP